MRGRRGNGSGNRRGWGSSAWEPPARASPEPVRAPYRRVRIDVERFPDYRVIPLVVADYLPKLRGRAGSVLLLAFIEAKRDGGGLWIYGSALGVAEKIGFGATVVKDAFATLEEAGLFIGHEPPRNAGAVGKVFLAPVVWPYITEDPSAY